MADLPKQTSLAAEDLANAKSEIEGAEKCACNGCRARITIAKRLVTSAYLRVEGIDLTKAKHEFEDKHPPGTPLSRHLKERERDYLRLVSTVNGTAQQGKTKGRIIQMDEAARKLGRSQGGNPLDAA